MGGRLLERIPSRQRVGLLDLVPDLSREVVSLRQGVAVFGRDNAELRRENSDPRRENLEFRRVASFWKSRHADAVVRVRKLEAEVEQLRGENRQ